MGSGGKKNGRRRKSRLAGWACIRLSRATAHCATEHVARLSLATSGPLSHALPAWQLGRAEAYGVTLQGVAPRVLARPKGIVLENLDLDRLLLKY